MNRGNETSALVKDEVGEAGVYVGSFRATYLAYRSQQRECMALERGVRIQAQSSMDWWLRECWIDFRLYSVSERNDLGDEDGKVILKGWESCSMSETFLYKQNKTNFVILRI